MGESLLDESLKNDVRVIEMENVNARYLQASDFPCGLDGIVADVSFISLKHIFPVISAILQEGKDAFTLIKPQFECEKQGIGKSGIVKKTEHKKIVKKVLVFAAESGLEPLEITNAPIKKGKNIEYVLHLKKNGATDLQNAISKARNERILNEIDVCKLALKRYKMVFPDKVGLVNLCPIIGRAADFTDENWNSEECTAWEYYLDKWLEGETATDYISYDHYPLLGSNSTGKTSIEPTFIVSMQYVAQRAKATNREMWTYLQSIGYGGANRIPTSAADISFQAYTFLAYGGKQISWFCYWSPIRYDGLTHFTEAMIELDGTKTAVYDYVKEINREILAFDDIYDNFEWQGSMTKVGRENAMGENDNFEYVAKYVMTSHPRIEKYTAEQDTLIGVFKDKAGKEDGFMVVNFTDPAKNLSNKIEITFKDTNYAAVVVDGELTTIKLNNGVLKLNLDGGDGAFVIPLK